ncbi:MAG: gliding motility-associated ABC transporter substrate-binding protein GldG [Bacteroidales bacterium]|nr:gliding motility-associated ABC transporter substrate-binding protein GldG [Bacteroidales bacterium]
MKLLKLNKTTGNRKKRSQRRSDWLELVAGLLIVVFLNIIGQYLFVRADLTAERRYTLSDATKQLLGTLDEPVLFRVYLEGDFPADFKRLQNETKEMLNQFRAYSSYVDYEFVDPNNFSSDEDRRTFYDKLMRKGIQPTQIQVRNSGGISTQVLVPAADVMYKGRETSIQLLQNQKYVAEDELLNNSIQSLEYVLSSSIRELTRGISPTIGFVTGHGELEGGVLYDIQMALQERYSLEYVNIDGNINALTAREPRKSDSTQYRFYNKYDLLIVAKPRKAFDDRDLYILDQYVMYGGKVLWFIDNMDADLDSLAHRGQMLSTRLPLNLEDMLFNYGVRINADLVQDIRCRPIPMTVGMVGDKPQIQFCPWFYFPEVAPATQHPIVRNLDLIKCDFCSSIDLIDNDISKTVLLATSEYSRVKNAPVLVDLNEAKVDVANIDQRLFGRSNVPVAVLLEGAFRSVYRGRLTPQFTELPAMGYRSEGEETKMIVVSDGDVIRNRYNSQEGTGFPVGYDHYTQTIYANKSFILNAVDYLTGGEGFIASRSRDVKMRKLDVMKVKEQRTLYQVFNIVLPSLLILLVGVVIVVLRRRRF